MEQYVLLKMFPTKPCTLNGLKTLIWINAGVVWLAGNTVWSTPERIRGEVFTTMCYTNRCLPLPYLLRTRSTFMQSVMASVAVSALGQTIIHFVDLGIKVNGKYYRDVLLTRDLLPEIKQYSEYFTFQQDGAPVHRARETVDLLKCETPDFISPLLCHLTVQTWIQLNDYAVWGSMEDRVYKTKVKDVEELRQHIVYKWEHLDQHIIDTAIRQWRKRLQACAATKGGQFEHALWHFVNINC